MINSFRKTQVYNHITPINDQPHGDNTLIRCKLASFARLVAYSWSNSLSIYLYSNPREDLEFISPYGTFFSEISASHFKNIETDGGQLSDTNLEICKTIRDSRNDIKNIIFIDTPEVIIATINPVMMKLPLCYQGQALVNKISDIKMESRNQTQLRKLQKAINAHTNIVLIEGLGAFVFHETIEQLWYVFNEFMQVLKIQSVIYSTNMNGNWLEKQATRMQSTISPFTNLPGVNEVQVYFESYLRQLDNQGHYSGYPYKFKALQRSNYGSQLRVEAKVAENSTSFLKKVDSGPAKTKGVSFGYAISPNKYEKKMVSDSTGGKLTWTRSKNSSDFDEIFEKMKINPNKLM